MNGTSTLVYAAWSTARMKHPQTWKTLYYRALHSARRCCCISCERAVESLIFISTFKKSEVDSGSPRSLKSTVHACRVVFFSLLLARARVCVCVFCIFLFINFHFTHVSSSLWASSSWLSLLKTKRCSDKKSRNQPPIVVQFCPRWLSSLKVP